LLIFLYGVNPLEFLMLALFSGPTFDYTADWSDINLRLKSGD